MKPKKFKQTEIGMIPEDWEVKPILSFATIKSGKRLPKGRDIVEDNTGFPYIRIRDLQDMSVNVPEVKFLEPDVQSIIKKYIITEKDIYISIVGTIGLVGTVPKVLNNANLTENCARLTELKIDRNYLKYFLNSKFGQNQIKSLTVGTTQGKLALSRIAKILVAIPEDYEQRSIAKILSSLDSKIELNQQMNKTLEAIGQAIFKRWFIDFEFPNEKGNPYKSSGGEMVNSELGEIPKGWKVGKLGDYGTFKNGINYLRGETGDTDFFIANVRDIANNKLLLKNSLDNISLNMKKAQDYLLKDKDILIARSASPGEVSLVLGNLDKVIYSGFSIRYRLNNPNNYLYIFLIMQRLKENLSNFAVGTTLQSVNQDTLKNMKFILPENRVLEKFNRIIEKILERTYGNLIQNSNLSQIRDSLLPRLMSGKIRVPVEVRT